MCQIASDVFESLPGLLAHGDTEKDLVRKFQAELLTRGADKTPYTAIGSGRGGYDSIIMGPTNRRLRKGDIFLIDTGARYGGYFCDFDRNYAVGAAPTDEVKRVHAALYEATNAGIRAATPGNTAADVFHAQAKVLRDAGFDLGNVGRFGHGLGKVMTEPPSNMPGDSTRLVPGMVLTIEPSAMYGKRQAARARGEPRRHRGPAEAAFQESRARDNPYRLLSLLPAGYRTKTHIVDQELGRSRARWMCVAKCSLVWSAAPQATYRPDARQRCWPSAALARRASGGSAREVSMIGTRAPSTSPAAVALIKKTIALNNAFAVSMFGTTNTSAAPATGFFIPLMEAASGESALSNASGPAMSAPPISSSLSTAADLGRFLARGHGIGLLLGRG